MSYQGVMLLASEHRYSTNQHPDDPVIDYLVVTKTCYEVSVSNNGHRFQHRTIAEKFPSLSTLPNLLPLKNRGILVRDGNTSKIYWRMPDIEGTGKALKQLGVI